MPEEPIKSDIVTIAQRLKMRKANNHPTVLFLGSRAGGLFRSEHFYETLGGFSTRDFNKLSREEQFRECYSILETVHLSETELDNLLKTSLQNLDTTEADICLAELVKDGIFHIVVSTNVDDFLERSFTQIEMKESREFDVSTPKGERHSEIIRPGKNLLCTIVKPFGDLTSREYSIINRDSYVAEHKEFNTSLESILTKDILVVGHDPAWDQSMGGVLSKEGEDFWFVNEETGKNPFILQVSRKRQTRVILGGDGEYASFLMALHWHLKGGLPVNYQLARDILKELRAINQNIQGLRQEIRRPSETIGGDASSIGEK